MKDAPPNLRTTKPKCLFPACAADPKTRGLCKNHYSTAMKLVSAGQISWAQLEKAKRAAPLTDRGSRRGKTQRWFMDALTLEPEPTTA